MNPGITDRIILQHLREARGNRTQRLQPAICGLFEAGFGELRREGGQASSSPKVAILIAIPLVLLDRPTRLSIAAAPAGIAAIKLLRDKSGWARQV